MLVNQNWVFPSMWKFSFLICTPHDFMYHSDSAHNLFKNWLDTTPQIANPIKLIVKVLNYARKNKYPKNCGALTYWEEDYPSQFDLGKEKYGGPFSVEEVEDVKTVLRFLPFESAATCTYNLIHHICL